MKGCEIGRIYGVLGAIRIGPLLRTVALLAAVVFAFRSTLFSAGVPNFRQDWRWPFLVDPIRASFPDVLGVWNSAGLGVPRVRVVNHPLLWVIHLLSLILPSRAILAVGIITTVFLTGLGVVVLARALRISAPIATCAGIVAALGAPMFNEFVAGHWYYMISIAAVPWAIASAVRYKGNSLPRAAATGAIIALTALQPQLWAITLIICVALFVSSTSWRNARSFFDILVLVATGAVLTLPELYGLVAAHSAARYADMQTIPMWESNNSAAFFAAAVGLGYAPGYVARALAVVPWASILLWLVPVAACAGTIVYRSERKVNVLAAAWLLALGLVSGVKGPFAHPLEYLYANFLWASAFRELYHFAEPMWIFAALLAAAFMERLRPPTGMILAVTAALGVLALWTPPGYAGTLRSWDFANRTKTLLSEHAPRTASRYLLTPSIQPLGPRGTAFAGADPDVNVSGVWFPLNSAKQYGVIGATLLLGELDAARYAGWLRAAGVNAVLPRPYLISDAIDSSPLSRAERRQAKRYFQHRVRAIPWRDTPEGLVELRSSLPIVRDPFTGRFHDGFLLEREVFSDPHDPETVPEGRRATPVVSRSAWNPAKTWVRGVYWWWIDPQVAFWPHSALTWSDQALRVPLAYRHDGYAHVIVFAGTLLAGQRVVHVRYGVASWEPLQGAAALQVRNGAAMVIEFARVERPYRRVHLPPASADASVVPVPFSVDCLCASMHIASRHTWVVLKQSYNDGWHLRVDNGKVLRHVVFAGYGNAWEVRASPGSPAFLVYAPAAQWQFLVTASLVVWLFVALGSAVASWAR